MNYRLLKHLTTSPDGFYAIISASRGENAPEQNAALTRQLREDLKEAGFPSMTKLIGSYVEAGGRAVVEESWLVIGCGDLGGFLDRIDALADKYEQETYILKTHQGTNLYDAKTGNCLIRFAGITDRLDPANPCSSMIEWTGEEFQYHE